jgi:hypothetical protein
MTSYLTNAASSAVLTADRGRLLLFWAAVCDTTD